MYRVSFSKRILGLPFTITSVVVRSARNPDRALRAAQLKFMRWSGIPHWRERANETEIESSAQCRDDQGCTIQQS
jgi:hypothetical protein